MLLDELVEIVRQNLPRQPLGAGVHRLLGHLQEQNRQAELGKTDQGGGGTVACYMANRNIDTIDAGVPVLSMHAPFETTAKLDCYMTYKAMKALYTH